MKNKKGDLPEKIVMQSSKTLGKHVIIVDGQEYICEREKIKKMDGIEHSEGWVFRKFDKKEFKENLQTVIKSLSKRTTKIELLTELLKNIDSKALGRLARRIKRDKPIKKQKGCLGFKVGDAYVQLVE